MSIKSFLVITLTVFITIILMQNTDEVKFKVLLWDLYLPKLVILTGVIFVGIVMGLLLGSRSKKTVANNYQNDQHNNLPPHDTLSQEDRDYIS